MKIVEGDADPVSDADLVSDTESVAASVAALTDHMSLFPARQ